MKDKNSGGQHPRTTRYKPQDRSLETRERLILVAERLFGEEGMGVSMRRINSEAEQKNVSAMHYHFGTRNALIEAICDYRMTRAAQRRAVIFQQCLDDGLEQDLRSMVRVAIWPLVEQIESGTHDNHFVRFLSQAHKVPELDNWHDVRHRNRHSLARTYVRILRLVDGVPRPVVHTRAVMGLRRAIHFLADLDRVIEQRHPELRDEMLAFYANDLIDMLVADLRAPLSPVTQQAYDVLRASDGRRSAAFFGPDALQALGQSGKVESTPR